MRMLTVDEHHGLAQLERPPDLHLAVGPFEYAAALVVGTTQADGYVSSKL